MRRHSVPIRLAWLSAAIPLSLVCGCTQPAQPNKPASAPPQQNNLLSFFAPGPSEPPKKDPAEVARVVCFYAQNPWMSFDPEGDPNPEGFRFTVYLASDKSGRGIIVDGQLRIELFRLENAGARQSVCDTRVDLSDLPRAAKETTLGWGYVCPFTWGLNTGETDLLGHDLDVVVSYVAPDGHAIRAQTKSLRVPGRRMR
ncbi:MAG TPA: hypothetical protein VGM03_18360 [Phycisphaerae bacterium]|jgi:hypothetical protein